MSELTPITRVESYLDAIVNSGIPPTEDITRIETFLQAIYDNVVCELTPITRIEMFLGKISGQDIVLPEPITRIELYLAAIAGEDVELPEEPITRIEMYLAEWADSGDWTTISGAIVEFVTTRAHKLKSCVVSLSPQQDLHGYDSPWPAGATAQKWDEEWEVGLIDPISGQNTNNDNYSCTKNYTAIVADTKYYFYFPTSITKLYLRFYDAEKNYLGYSQFNSKQLFTPSIVSSQFATAAYIRFCWDGNTYGNNISLNYPSTDHDYHPFSNICPISGWTGVNVWDTGTNVCVKTIRGFPNVGSQIITIDGDAESAVFYAKKGETYTISHSTQATRNSLVLVGTENITGGTPYTEIETYNLNINTWTATWEGWTVWYRIPNLDQDFENTAQIQIGSETTDYEEYKGNSYSVTFGETVYGAEPDLISGGMPVTMDVVDLASLTWSYQSTWRAWYTDYNPTVKGTTTGAETPNFISEQYATISTNYGMSPQNEDIGITSTVRDDNGCRIIVRNGSSTTQPSGKLAYELATPTTTTITPTPITALKGYNAVWSDAGDIEVTVHGTPVEVETLQALNMLLGGAYHNNQTAEDVSDDEALDIILGGENK